MLNNSFILKIFYGSGTLSDLYMYGSAKHRGQHWEGLQFFYQERAAAAARVLFVCLKWKNKSNHQKFQFFSWTMDSAASLRKFTPSVPEWPFDLI